MKQMSRLKPILDLISHYKYAITITICVLLAIFILGGDSIRSFSFAMIVGVVVGTLSSIFLASPIAYIVLGKKINNMEDNAEQPVAAEPVKA